AHRARAATARRARMRHPEHWDDPGRPWHPACRLVLFGLFLATLGYLLVHAGIEPPPIGYALVAAGLASCTLLIPQFPPPLIALVLGFGALAEGAFALWLLVTG